MSLPREIQPLHKRATRAPCDEHAFGRPLSLQRPPLCPELALWLVAEDVDLEAGCDALREGQAPPYWAFCWGAGQALARYLLDHPTEVAGRRVVDFGAGSGVAGIAAAIAGARSVTCVDLDSAAREAALANARANELPDGLVGTATDVPGDWDVFLASDVLYEELAARAVRAQLRRCSRDQTLLVAEPHRPGNPRWDAELLARYDVVATPDVDSPCVAASIHRLW